MEGETNSEAESKSNNSKSSDTFSKKTEKFIEFTKSFWKISEESTKHPIENTTTKDNSDPTNYDSSILHLQLNATQIANFDSLRFYEYFAELETIFHTKISGITSAKTFGDVLKLLEKSLNQNKEEE